MRKFLVVTVVGSPAIGIKNGVLILFHKMLLCSIKLCESEGGRLAHALVDCPLGKLSFYRVYGPNSDNQGFYQVLRDKLFVDPIAIRF